MSSKRPNPQTKLNADIPSKKPKQSGHWSLGLLRSIDDPEYFVKSDDLVTVIKDRYPKAEFHYLVIPKEKIGSLKVVTSEHLKLLKHMEEVGVKLTKDEKHKGKSFKLGYHADPSMYQLHLHVISDDMNSVCLKNKKHWNSFTTGFFLNSKVVCEELELKGKIQLPSAEILKKFINSPLKCNKCNLMLKNLPDLKKHISSHVS